MMRHPLICEESIEAESVPRFLAGQPDLHYSLGLRKISKFNAGRTVMICDGRVLLLGSHERYVVIGAL